MNLEEFAALLEQDTQIKGSPKVKFSSVSIDSRKVKPGDLFFAIKGQRDGHEFVQDAADGGAAAAVVDHPVPVSIPQVVVKDVRAALLESAAKWRSRFKIPVIAVAGSNGKTTTTQMILSILSVRYEPGQWVGTEGNLNNDMGVAMMLWKLRPEHQIAAFEAGMNHIGEMAPLVKAIAPTVATVTNTQRDHQEFLASLEETAKENGEVFKYLPLQGAAIINVEDPFYTLWRTMAGNTRVVTFGNSNADVYATYADDGFVLNTPVGKTLIKLQVPGDHNVKNAVCAAAVQFALGRDLSDIKKGLESFKAVRHRGELTRLNNGSIVIDDSYNANPDSMSAAVKLLASYKQEKILVLGDMAELGVKAPQYHREIGVLAKSEGIKNFFSIGNRMLDAVDGYGEGARHFDTQEDLLNAIKEKMAEQPHVILFKASNSMKLFELADQLCKENQ